jgi:hypothetical protein
MGMWGRPHTYRHASILHFKVVLPPLFLLAHIDKPSLQFQECREV